MSAPTPLDLARRAHAPIAQGAFREVFQRGIRTSRMTPQTRLVALTLATYASAGGDIPAEDQPGLHGLAAATGLSAGRVVVQLQILEQRGWLGRSGGARYESAVIRLAVPPHVVPRVLRT